MRPDKYIETIKNLHKQGYYQPRFILKKMLEDYLLETEQKGFLSIFSLTNSKKETTENKATFGQPTKTDFLKQAIVSLTQGPTFLLENKTEVKEIADPIIGFLRQFNGSYIDNKLQEILGIIFCLDSRYRKFIQQDLLSQIPEINLMDFITIDNPVKYWIKWMLVPPAMNVGKTDFDDQYLFYIRDIRVYFLDKYYHDMVLESMSKRYSFDTYDNFLTKLSYFSSFSDIIDPKKGMSKLESYTGMIYKDWFKDKPIIFLGFHFHYLAAMAKLIYRSEKYSNYSTVYQEYCKYLAYLLIYLPIGRNSSSSQVMVTKLNPQIHHEEINNVIFYGKKMIVAMVHCLNSEEQIKLLIKQLSAPIPEEISKNLLDKKFHLDIKGNIQRNHLRTDNLRQVYEAHQQSTAILITTLHALIELAPTLNPDVRAVVIAHLQKLVTDDSEIMILICKSLNLLTSKPLEDEKLIDVLADYAISNASNDRIWLGHLQVTMNNVLHYGNHNTVTKLAKFIHDKSQEEANSPVTMKICYQLLCQVNPYVIVKLENEIDVLIKKLSVNVGVVYYDLVCNWCLFSETQQIKILEMLWIKYPKSLLHLGESLLKLPPEDPKKENLTSKVVTNLLIGFRHHACQTQLIPAIMKLSFSLPQENPLYLEHLMDFFSYMEKFEKQKLSLFPDAKQDYKDLEQNIRSINLSNQAQLLKLLDIFVGSYSVEDYKGWFGMVPKKFAVHLDLNQFSPVGTLKEKICLALMDEIYACQPGGKISLTTWIDKWCSFNDEIPDQIIDQIINYLNVISDFVVQGSKIDETQDLDKEERLIHISQKINELVLQLKFLLDPGFSLKLKPYQSCYLANSLSLVVSSKYLNGCEGLFAFRINLTHRYQPKSKYHQVVDAEISKKLPPDITPIIIDYLDSPNLKKTF